MKYTIFVLCLTIINVSCNSQPEKESPTTELALKNISISDFETELKLFYVNLNPHINFSKDTTEFENFFGCKNLDVYNNFSILTASYILGYDAPYEIAIILSEFSTDNNRNSYFLKTDPLFWQSINKFPEYNSKHLDSILSKINYLKQIDKEERNKIIAKIVLLYTVEASRLAKNGSDLCVKYHLTLNDIFEINSTNINSFETKIRDTLSLLTDYPNYDYWEKYISDCCIGDSTYKTYNKIITNLNEFDQENANQKNSFIQFSRKLIIDSSFQYLNQFIDKRDNLFYYTVPDLQLYEVIIEDNPANSITATLKWLYPRVEWQKTYLPILPDSPIGEHEPSLVN